MSTTDQSEATQSELDTASPEFKKEVIESALHALTLEYKFSHKKIPIDSDLQDWLEPIWPDRDRVKNMIVSRNPWAMKFADRHPTFWASLSDALWPNQKNGTVR